MSKAGKYLIVASLEHLCTILDHVPAFSGGHWYWAGQWGCQWRIATMSARLDEHWGRTGWWKEPKSNANPDHGV